MEGIIDKNRAEKIYFDNSFMLICINFYRREKED